jgi:hypothetical protein
MPSVERGLGFGEEISNGFPASVVGGFRLRLE